MLTLTKPGIEEYAESKSEPVSALLSKLARDTYETMPVPWMLTGRLEGRFLKMMVQISAARNVLEIGMFTGYSALSMAEGLPEGGTVTTLDIDPACIEFAKSYFERSPFGGRIEVVAGPALESLNKLSGPFDFVFIDADKVNYQNYYEAVLPKLTRGGVILVDNVLYSGYVVDPHTTDENARAIAAFNDFVAADERVDRVMLTIRDGVYLIRKR
ncbi:MAG: methyltransferase domain-containing protein [Candidatus Competibacteraceae bacterium]|nr:methyltransferase domain-containing protein [Candidatus Competibacteraceae bacterium]